MDFDFAFLADAADVAQGKLFVLGGVFNTIQVNAFPAVHPMLAVVIHLLLGPNDLDRQHQLEILLLDADARHLASAQGNLIVPKSPDSPQGWRQSVILPLRFFNISFQQAGHYSIEILMNEKMIKAIPLRVLQAPENA